MQESCIRGASSTSTTPTVNGAQSKSNSDSTKDGIAYACLLKNELLGAGIEDVKEQQQFDGGAGAGVGVGAGQRAVLMPKEARNLFQVSHIVFLFHYCDIIINTVGVDEYVKGILISSMLNINSSIQLMVCKMPKKRSFFRY